MNLLIRETKKNSFTNKLYSICKIRWTSFLRRFL